MPLDADKLVLGHAGKEAADAVTLDINPDHNPDVVHNLNAFPWPFEDNRFREIVCHHVLEHLTELDPVMDELHRICKPGGEIYIDVPHHSSWCAHTPEHKLFFTAFAFDGYCEGNHSWRTGRKFRMVKRRITFHRAHRRYFLHKIFNRFLMSYERFWTYIFPAEHFQIWLTPVK